MRRIAGIANRYATSATNVVLSLVHIAGTGVRELQCE